MLPDLVPPEELMAMVSLGIYSWNGGRIIGPLLGTVLFRFAGPAWTVGFNALTFAVMAGAVALLRKEFLPVGSAVDGIRERLVEGWHALQRIPGCRYGIVMIMILNLSVGPFMGLIPIYAREVFGGGTGLAGIFSAVQGVGAIVGSLTITVLAVRRSRANLVVISTSILVTAYLVYALAPTAVVAGVAVMWMGAGSASVFVSSMAIVQRDATAGERGRILSITHAAMGLCYGVLWIGVVGDVVNLRVAFGLAAAVAVTASVFAARRTPGWRSVIDGAAAHDAVGSSPSMPPAEVALV
jgi:MFS family permease